MAHAHTLLRRDAKLKGNRTATPVRTGPFGRLSKVWRFSFLSLLIDAVVARYCGAALPAEKAQVVALLCAAITLPFLNQQRVARSLATLRRWQSGSLKKRSQTIKPLIGLVIALLIGGKLILLPTINNVASLLVAGIIILGIISSMKHVMNETRARSHSLAQAPWLYVLLWERQLVALLCIPIVAARLISLCGALSLGSASHPTASVVYLLIGIVLLLALKPQRSTFIGWCPSCKSPAPIAFVEYGSCPRCNEELARHD